MRLGMDTNTSPQLHHVVHIHPNMRSAWIGDAEGDVTQSNRHPKDYAKVSDLEDYSAEPEHLQCAHDRRAG